MKVLLTHPGTQYSHQLAYQLYRHGHLHEFWTGIAIAEDTWKGSLTKLLPLSLHKHISNRVLRGVPAKYLRTVPMVELSALRRFRRGDPPPIVCHERNKKFQKAIPDSTLEKSSSF